MSRYSMEQDIQSLLKNNPIQIPKDLHAFEGHFPDNPIVPGIYSLELAVQCAIKELKCEAILKKVHRCKFNQPVLPGMVFCVKVKFLSQEKNTQKVKVQFFCDDLNVLDATITVELLGI